ncbi:MAG: NmrA family transcriptional regulator [Nitrospira sp.]|nr:MAG: NmrA family transcriptional regulator [Nitrospira sp.]
MKIVVIGGSGLIGTKLVNRLRKQGHEVVAASPKSGVNTLTGEGLPEALAGAQVVVDVANSRHRPPSREWVLPREDGPGKSDQGVKDSLYDRPINAVLRIRGRHRPI